MEAASALEVRSVIASPEARRYLDETVRVWLGLPLDAGVGPPRLPDRLARRLLRMEEHECARRDPWGRWEPECAEDGDGGDPRLADVDRWVAERRAQLGAEVDLEPLWPDGRPCAVCLTHDVDVVSPQLTPRQAARFVRAGLARTVGVRQPEPLRLARPPVRVARALRAGVSRTPATRDTIERSVALEARRGLVASYLFSVPPAGGRSRFDCTYATEDTCLFRGMPTRLADLMRTLADEGFDIGLHGSYWAGVRRGALEAEREALERATGLEVRTTRQHLLHWDVRWTPALQEAAGLRVDSSVGFNRDVGFRAGTSLPFRFFDVTARRALAVLEVPLVVQDVALLGAFGRHLPVERAVDVVRQLVDSAAVNGSALTFVFHPDALVRRDWAALYESTLDYAVARGAWIGSLDQLATWWREREARLL